MAVSGVRMFEDVVVMFSADGAAPRRSGSTLSLFAIGVFKRNFGIILLSL